jgi:hypothetical protein
MFLRSEEEGACEEKQVSRWEVRRAGRDRTSTERDVREVDELSVQGRCKPTRQDEEEREEKCTS